MKKHCFSQLGIITAGLFLIGANSTTLAQCPRDELRLSEIHYDPLEAAHQYVEIFNAGDTSVDVRGIELVSGVNSYSVPATVTEEIPPGGFLLVRFDDASPETDDISFAGDNLAELHGGPTDFLGNPNGHCYLYRTTGLRSPDLVIDFVAWGAAPGSDADTAIAKGIWDTEDDHIYTKDSPEDAPAGPTFSMVPGGSLVTDELGNWTVAGPTDTSPGAANTLLRAPLLFVPNDGEESSDVPPMFVWTPQGEAASFDFQIASDDTFTTLARDITGYADYRYFFEEGDSLDSGEYWWRVRAVNTDGDKSEWSQVFKFSVFRFEFEEDEPAFTAPEEESTPVPSLKNQSGLDPRFKAGEKDTFLTGTVKDAATGVGLKGVALQIFESGDLVTVVDTDSTDASGEYILFVPSGNYKVVPTLENFTFSGPNSLTVDLTDDVDNYTITATGARAFASVIPLGAQKDTTMLQVRHRNNWMCTRTNTATDQAWDRAHAKPHPGANELESWYCGSVSSTMIGRYYGGTLKLDEVVWHVKKLGFARDAGTIPAEEKKALRFALQTTDDKLNYTMTKWTEAQIKAAIDAKRPIYYVQPRHVVTADAYVYAARAGGEPTFWVRFVNLDNKGAVRWQRYATKGFWRGAIPNAGLTGRKTDADVGKDTDGDGVNDFDEANRFGTDKTKKDTDGDGVEDKWDIASWVFPRKKEQGGNISGGTFLAKNIDGDGKDPQVDEDTDNGGLKDGEEDINGNGIFEEDTETDVYKKEDDGVLDLVFVVDATGSMSDDIAQVKANAIGIVNEVKVKFPDFRMGIVDYKDHPPQDSFGARLQLAFTNDESTIINGINRLGASGGGDFPEAVYAGLMLALDGAALGGWREGGSVKRAIILFGDAPPHDPEPVTGHTLSTVLAKAFAGGVTFSVPTPRSAPGRPPVASALAPEIASAESSESGSINIFSLFIGNNTSAKQSFTDIAEGSGGSLITASSASQVPGAVLDLLDEISAAPSAVLAVTQEDGSNAAIGATKLNADLSSSSDPQGCGIVLYKWDWDGDGTFDEETTLPTASHEYPSGFGGALRASITTSEGSSATATLFLEASEVEITETKTGAINGQNGLFEQELVIQSDGSPFNLTVNGLPDGVEVYNVTEDGGTVIPVDPQGAGTVSVIVQYYIASRSGAVIDGITYSVASRGSAVDEPTPTGETQAAICKISANGELVVEFASEPGKLYVIEYSDDNMETWKVANQAVKAFGGNRTQWIDSGPPKTDSDPGEKGSRFYRVSELD